MQQSGQLHNKGASWLGNPDAFLDELQARFGDNTQIRQAESEICTIKQGNRLVTEYIHEFWILARKLRISDDIYTWYQPATNMELDLIEYKRHGGAKSRTKKSQERHSLG
ncbi:hypothetical protein L345_03337, partial [Ophiophagus hannah]